MDKRPMLDMPHLESHVATDDESILPRQNAALRCQIAALREDNEDLRASALWWNALYEEAQRRYADLENSPKARPSARVNPRFRMTSSSSAHASRPGATTRPL
jgi:hypothetical protein